MKFGRILCARCNNERSQPFDMAYDRFIEWFLANEKSVEATGEINLEGIYEGPETGALDLLRYFGKHVGCRIAEKGYAVPPPLRAFLDGRHEPLGFVLSFEVNGRFSALNDIIRGHPTKHGTAGNLYLGPVTGQARAADGHATLLSGWWGYHGLQLVWEWRADFTGSWTNLLPPCAQLPLVDQREARPLRRVGRDDAVGRAWRSWYRARKALGAPLPLPE